MRPLRIGGNQNKPKDIRAGRNFVDEFANKIKFEGIEKIECDTAFDNNDMTSAGTGLFHRTTALAMAALRLGVLLEVGATKGHRIAPGISARGCTSMPPQKIRSKSSAIVRRASFATIRIIRSWKSLKPFL